MTSIDLAVIGGIVVALLVVYAVLAWRGQLRRPLDDEPAPSEPGADEQGRADPNDDLA